MSKNVAVQILGKEYQVACPEGEEHNLIDAAYYLDQQMLQIRHSGRVLGPEKAVVMVALNIVDQLLRLKAETTHQQEQLEEKIIGLSNKISRCLVKQLGNPREFLNQNEIL